jgi:NDP-sugar pyrophosphorylase family protein
MQAVIFAGGKGERLRPYTAVLPKPLLPIGDLPILEVSLRQLRRAGFTRVTLAVSHLAELVERLCGDGSRLGLEVRYSRECAPLSTAGPLKLIDGLDETFLAMNGDVLTTIDYRALLDFHRVQRAVATVATHRRTMKVDLGVLEIADDGALIDYIEKPEYQYRVSMGVYALEPRVRDYIGHGEALDMPALLCRLRDAGERVLTYEWGGLWLHIARRDDYEEALSRFEHHRGELLGENAEKDINDNKHEGR